MDKNKLDILEDRKESIRERLAEISKRLENETDSTTRGALVENLKNGMIELEAVKRQIKNESI